MQITDAPTPSGGPWLAKGFRPFFALAALWAALSVVAWLLVLRGYGPLAGPLVGTAWHAHEMVFGFTVAIMAGFLLTSTASWTGRETLTGWPLALLALCWIAARVALAVVPGTWGLVPDLVFLPALVAVLGRPLVRARQLRNAPFPLLLAALWGLDLAGHLGGDVVGASRAGVSVAIAMIVLVTGRIVPLFTRNATGGAEIRSWSTLDHAAVLLAVTAPMAAAVAPTAGAIGSAACALVLVLRSRRWGARRALREPLLLVLHVGHAAVAAGFLLYAASCLGWIPRTLALHAWTVGGIGLVGLGMMARVTLGHTGRPLRASPATVLAFLLIGAAAGVRVVGPLVAPERWATWVLLAGVGWSSAFLLWIATAIRGLGSARPDGRPG